MDMDSRNSTLSVLEWDEEAVIAWLSRIGFPRYASQIRAHNISGDVLTKLDEDKLIEVGVGTIGQRDAILKAVYYLKLSHNVPIHADHYVPPFQIEDYYDGVVLQNLHKIVKEQADRLRRLEYENESLLSDLRMCLGELGDNVNTTAVQARVSPSAPEHDIFYSVPALKPTREAHLPPDCAPSRLQRPPATLNSPINDRQSSSDSDGILSGKVTSTSTSTPTPSNDTPAPKPPRSESNEGSKDEHNGHKVSLEDPAWKILPMALNKYNINDDYWQNYAMFICYGNTERCVNYDEKPLLLFQHLKDAKKNPAFVLKHIRDIRSPIVVAQRKQAARQMAKAGEVGAAAASASTPTAARWDIPQRVGASDFTAWLTSDAMAPSMEHEQQEDGTSPGDDDVIPTPNDISYAVAIYPYMAEQEDELDVVVEDTFIILQRARGWCVVQRDPNGSLLGIVENDPSNQGRVPSGCLLETSVPVASAVAEATGDNTTADGKPILPRSIISTSFSGIALVDYTKKGEEELDLKKDDALRVFKRHHHWSYVVKESGARGWVPSWFIGKVER